MLTYPGRIQPGSTVTMHFAIRATDGTEMESSFGNEPETFVVGDGSILPGFEMALTSLKTGDRQTITLTPEQAYGVRDPDRETVIPRAHFAADMELAPGAVVGFESAEGHLIPGTVVKVLDEAVEVDFNHPLAGQEVVLEVEILNVIDPETDADE